VGRLAIGVLAAFLSAHAVWSSLVAYGFERFYDHRLPDLTKIASRAKDWEPFLHAFWQANARRDLAKPTIAFIGSSMTYGYPWQEPVIFTRVFSERMKGWNVSNMSYYSADIWGIREYLLCPLVVSRDLMPDVLVVEIPLVNSIRQIHPGDAPRKRKCMGSSEAVLPGYFSFVFRRPIGTGWIPLLWDDEAYQKRDQEIQITKVDANYFASEEKFKNIEREYRRDLRAFLDEIAGISRKVFIFISPIYLPGVDEAGADRAAVKRQMEVTWDVCRSHGAVICLSLDEFSENRNLFYNITHFNQQGHRVFGEWLGHQISLKERPFLN